MRNALIIALMLSIGFNILQWIGARKAQTDRLESNSQLNEVIEAKTATIATKDSAISYILKKIQKDTARYKVALMRRNEEIKGYKAAIVKLRPKLQAKIDSFPDLRQFVALQDSVISKQDSLIRSQELFCQLQVTDLQEIISMTQQKYEAQVQISKLWEQSAVEYEQESNKLRKQAKFKNLVIYGLGGVVLWMAITD